MAWLQLIFKAPPKGEFTTPGDMERLDKELAHVTRGTAGFVKDGNGHPKKDKRRRWEVRAEDGRFYRGARAVLEHNGLEILEENHKP